MKCKHKKVEQAICRQILAYQISVFPVDEDHIPKHGAVRDTAHCFCKIIFFKSLNMLIFSLKLLKRIIDENLEDTIPIAQWVLNICLLRSLNIEQVDKGEIQG